MQIDCAMHFLGSLSITPILTNASLNYIESKKKKNEIFFILNHIVSTFFQKNLQIRLARLFLCSLIIVDVDDEYNTRDG
jgi:hypothetical protein